MASFEQHNIQAVKPGKVIQTNFDGKIRRLKKMFVCPYKDTLHCPMAELDHDYSGFVNYPNCNMSPIINKEDGRSLCDIVIDLDEPNLWKTLTRLSDFIAFREMKGE